MPDMVRRIQYFHVTVPDRPGEGLRVLALLEQHKVNLTAYLGFPAGGGQSQLDLLPEDPAALARVAREEGLQLSAGKPAFLVQGDDRPGTVADLARKLCAERINITAAFATCAGRNRYGMVVWVPAADYERAARAIGV